MNAVPWQKRIEEAIEEAKLIPLWGHFPSFPWSEFSQQMALNLEFEELDVQHHHSQWKPHADLLSGMGEHPIIIPLEMGPFNQMAFWVMSFEDVKKLTTDALSPLKRLKGILDPDYQKGFYRYLCLNAFQILDRLEAFDDLTLRMRDATLIPEESAFCIDISIKTALHSIWGRVICPHAFFHDFRQHFLQKKVSPFPHELTEKIETCIHLEIGHVNLRLDQWKQVKVGDFILLDKCTFDPATGKGSVALLLENTPLFRARIKHNQIKIIDEVFYYEEDKLMPNNSPDEEEDEIDEEDEEEEDEEESDEKDLDEEEEDESEENPDESLSEAELEEGKAEGAHLWSAKGAQEGAQEQMISSNEIPLSITVEVARLRMTLDKVLQLKPGNLLELSIQPEAGVDLCVNGKKIAKGELIKLGEMLGVKILQIGE